MRRCYNPWTGHSLANNNYENPQVSDKQFSPEPRRLGTIGPHPKPTPLQPRRSQEIQTRDWTDDVKGMHRFLEDVMAGPGPAPRPDDWEKTYLPAGAHMTAIHAASNRWRLDYQGQDYEDIFERL